MRAMLLDAARTPLRFADVPDPEPGAGQVRIRVHVCGVCRTDLHVLDGELTKPKLPLVLGHQIVGEIVDFGTGVGEFRAGDRVGVPWLGWTCGVCTYCRSGRENLCDRALFTGYDIDGGYAEFAVADARYCFRIDDSFSDVQAAPLLCAGLIGYRALVAQVARHQGREVYAITRPGDTASQAFARDEGAAWAGDTDEEIPERLDAAIIFAPAGELIPKALAAVDKGGVVVCAGIHMSEIPAFSYDLLWGERSVRSVANLTRRDGIEFLALAARVPVQTVVETRPLEQANEALAQLREGKVQGSLALTIA
jgi:propanol-preferring alcohol dehydrogenase